MIATVIIRGCDDDTWFVIPADEVKRREDKRFEALEKAGVV